MLFDYIMVRYGELSLKGKNKKYFINTLANNICNALKDISGLKFDKQFDRFYIKLASEDDIEEIINRLKYISGIHNFSLVSKVNKDINNINDKALEIIKTLDDEGTFKVITTRSDKTFPMLSDEINRSVAATILKNSNLKVDVHNPNIKVKVEIRYDAAYISILNYDGLGGFPLGTNGKGLLMISGGIDSPVAGFEMIKKGVKIEAIHFSSPPYTSEMAVNKVKTLLAKLASIQGSIRFINVPFTKLQLKIYEECGESYAITIMRRMMYRLAAHFAEVDDCLCIINGESIGQVASQTLESMQVINNVTNKVIIRPLATYDKDEIIRIAKSIDTYDTSILPFEDCCTIFEPKNPVTKPRLHECERLESKFDFEALLQEAIENAEIIEISN